MYLQICILFKFDDGMCRLCKCNISAGASKWSCVNSHITLYESSIISTRDSLILLTITYYLPMDNGTRTYT